MMRMGENAKGLVRGAFCVFSLVRGSTGSAFTRQRCRVRPPERPLGFQVYART